MNQVIALIDKYVGEAKAQEKHLFYQGKPEQLAYWQGHIDALLLLKDEVLGLDSVE